MRARVLKITCPAAPWYNSRFWNPRKWVVAVVRSYASTPLRGVARLWFCNCQYAAIAPHQVKRGGTRVVSVLL